MNDSLNKCKQLTHLWLRFPIPFLLKTSHIDNISHKFPKIQYLYLNCVELNDSSLNSLAKLSHLHTLHITYRKQRLSDDVINELVESNPKIRFIDIKYEKFM